mmetsp:Transcript_16395/g.34684  ORF Transcript_16395/g.34684 Transcript_16395/m.34684 type:complete len:215 (-) Transcript_16395:1030-1674(-)
MRKCRTTCAMLSGTAGLSKMGPFHTRPRLLYGCDAAKYIHNYYGDSAGSKEIGEICFGQQGAAVLTTHSISRQNKLGISLPSVMTNADTFPSMGHSTDQPIYPIDCRLPGSKGTAPICQDPLAQDFGHMSVQCPAAQAVLTGNYYNPHPDDATEDLFNEIADTWALTNKTGKCTGSRQTRGHHPRHRACTLATARQLLHPNTSLITVRQRLQWH